MMIALACTTAAITLGQLLSTGAAWGWIAGIAVVLAALLVPLVQVCRYRNRNPKTTPLMAKNRRGWERSGEQVDERRVDLVIDEVPEMVVNVVDSAEDLGTFLYHNGFLSYGMRLAFNSNRKGNSLRGGSTISQQTAKNCFLSPRRTIMRKVVVVYYTFLIEKIWGKRRIMECYLNIVEMGKGIYGFEAACLHYFGHSIREAVEEEAIQLAALLPCPTQWSPLAPTPNYLKKVDGIRNSTHNNHFLGWDYQEEDKDPEKARLGEQSLFHFVKWLINQYIHG